MRARRLLTRATSACYTVSFRITPPLLRDPMGSPGGIITQLLVAWREGDETAKDQLFAFFYEDLRQIAREQRDKWRGSNTLNTTALLHELYVKLSRKGAVRAEDRGQFNRFVAKALRRILMDYARMQGRQRRGGDWVRIPLDEIDEDEVVTIEMPVDDLLLVDMAISKLAVLDTRLAEVVELRFYGGLTYDEIALSLGITKRTVTRDWAYAKVWLHRLLQAGETQKSKIS